MKKSNSNFIFRFFSRIRNALFYLLNFIFLLSILAHLIPPSKFIWIAPFGFLFFPILIIHFLILIIYFKQNNRISIVAIILIICSLKFIPRTFTFHSENPDKGIKIASWNVKNFDLYNWTNIHQSRLKIIALIDTVNADIICLQEFHTDEGTHNNILAIQKLGYPYYSFYPLVSHASGSKWGLAIFSKYPLSNSKIIPIHKDNNKMNCSMIAQIKAKGKVYNVCNSHFQSIHLDYDDYDHINQVKKTWSQLWNKHSFKLFNKILMSYKKREEQIAVVSKKVNNDIPKTIFCCDLNDIPNSYAYNKIASNYNDAFVECGKGFSNTTGILFASFRIDYIFASKDMQIQNYKRVRTQLSDHHLIYAHID